MLTNQGRRILRNSWFSIYRSALSGCIVVLLYACSNEQNGLLEQRESSLKTDSASMLKLGRYLFYDNHLSFNQTKSCSSCHDPALAFTDGYRTSSTATGDNVLRNAPSLVNVVFQKRLDWANPYVTNSYEQNERPLFNEHPVELGFKNNEEIILEYFRDNDFYRALFTGAFPNDTGITVINVRKSLAAFVNSLVSTNSAYDAYMKGDSARLSSAAKNGLKLFFSPKLMCATCHAPPLFTVNDKRNDISPDSIYFNSAVEVGDSIDKGLFLFTHKAEDIGKFKVPSLRNVALTAPYMHDGSLETLGNVIDLYSRRRRRDSLSNNSRIEFGHDKRMQGFSISKSEKKDLIAFLHCLTDSTILMNPLFSNPNSY